MSDDVVAILQAAKERVAAGWCQGMLGMGNHGKTVRTWKELRSPSVKAVCATGAIHAVSYGHLDQVGAALGFLGRAIGHADIPVWNDKGHRTQADVLDAFDAAIRLAKEQA